MSLFSITSHSWDIIHSPDKLRVKLLTCKYLSNSHIFDEVEYKGASYQDIFYSSTGFYYDVSKGDVSLWYDKWLREGTISSRIPFLKTHDIHTCITDICEAYVFEASISYTPSCTMI